MQAQTLMMSNPSAFQQPTPFQQPAPQQQLGFQSIIQQPQQQVAAPIVQPTVQPAVQPGVIFFFSEKDPKNGWMSNWFPATFKGTSSGWEYNSSEQYMMSTKARLMNDFDSQKAIMAVKQNVFTPAQQFDWESIHQAQKKIKDLGRAVKNFDAALWDANKIQVVRQGLMYKFLQNDVLLQMLMSTGNDYLIEASPYDRVWGIGLSEKQARVTPIEQWGQNLLGNLLMEVRNVIRTKGKEAFKWAYEVPAAPTGVNSNTREEVKVEAPVEDIKVEEAPAPAKEVEVAAEEALAPVEEKIEALSTEVTKDEETPAPAEEVEVAIEAPVKEPATEAAPIKEPVEEVKETSMADMLNAFNTAPGEETATL